MPSRSITRAMARVAALLLVAGLGALALGAAGPATAGEQKSTITTNYRTDPYLSAGQKYLLDRLAARSTTTLAAESWAHGRSVGRLELAVPSGLDGKGSLADHALAFVTAHSALWNLPDGVGLDVVSTVADKECSGVTLALTVGELRVYNATVTVIVTPDGTVRGVAGRLDGRDLRQPVPSRTTASDAAKVVRTFLEKKMGGPAAEAELPSPTEIIVDPFFLTEDDHEPAEGWLFTTEAGGVGQAGVVVVNGASGSVAMGGTGAEVPNRIILGCPDSNPAKTVFPYIVDPMTNTPAIVDFGQYGTPTQGATPVERAYDLLSQPFMGGLYGDRDPRRHLKDPEVIATVGGRTTVRFAEYYGGLPVDGARLSVLLLPNGNARLITARFVHFPHARTSATVSEADAVTGATAAYRTKECGGDSVCLAALDDSLSAHPPVTSLVILSSEIFEYTNIPQLPAGQERLAYKVEFTRRVVYWDAIDGGELYDDPTRADAIPHTIRNAEEEDRVEVIDGVPVTGVTPHQDATRVASWLSALDAFFLGLGRNGFDGNGGFVDVRVRADLDNAYWCPDYEDEAPCDVRINVGPDFTSADIVGHEFGHGVVQFTTGYTGRGEARALHEHYADVFANTAFPDSNPNEWLAGEESIKGASRDMANPGTFDDPAHYSVMRAYCDHSFCSHAWAGVPNRAAVLISDGGVPGSTHPGVGRPTLAKLYLATLESGLGGKSDLFLDERINTIAICEALVQDGAVIDGRSLTPDDCSHVGQAFTTVGIDAPIDVGWTVFTYFPAWPVVIRNGLHLLNGCTIRDHVLTGDNFRTGERKTSNVAGGLSINFSNEWGARVIDRGAATDPTDRTVSYGVWSYWYGFGVVDVHERYDVPPGLTDEDCRRPVGTQRRMYFSSERVSHWATFFDGHKGDDTINQGRSLPPFCTVDAVRGLHYHDWRKPLLPAVESVSHVEHGFRITSTGGSSTDLAVTAHWWHSGISSIKMRVVYEVFEPNGMTCLVPGLQDKP